MAAMLLHKQIKTAVPQAHGCAAYARVDRSARTAGADPHQLIAILFEELLTTIATLPLALDRQDYAQVAHRQTRAITLLHGLETALDHDAAPELATSLARCYREARRLLVTGMPARDMTKVKQAHSIIAVLADAWAGVRPG